MHGVIDVPRNASATTRVCRLCKYFHPTHEHIGECRCRCIGPASGPYYHRDARCTCRCYELSTAALILNKLDELPE